MLKNRRFALAEGLAKVCKRWLALLGIALLASCGGGGGGGGGAGGGGGGGGGTTSGAGGGFLNVSLRYGTTAYLFRRTIITPRIDGLGTQTPECSLVSGSLPPGLTLGGDCAITGTPTQAGVFPITVRLAASGLFQRDFSTSVLVLGPSVTYQIPSTLGAGSSVDLRPTNVFWTPTAADTVTYSVVGTLPPGLSVDAATGRIHGTPGTPGFYEFQIVVQVVNGGRTAVQLQEPGGFVTIVVPTILYDLNQAWVGLPFTSTPTLPAGGISYQFSTTGLPPGLTLDAQTGVISGTTTTPEQYPRNLSIQLSGTGSGGGSFSTGTNLQLYVNSPVYVLYPGGFASMGQPFTMTPWLTNNSGDPLTGITYNYALRSGTLPVGLSLDPTSGTIAGTFPDSGYGRFTSLSVDIDLTITLHGISFVTPLSASLFIQ